MILKDFGVFLRDVLVDFGRGVSLVASGEPLVFEACTWYLCYRERSLEDGKLIFERLSMRNTCGRKKTPLNRYVESIRNTILQEVLALRRHWAP